MKDAREKLGDAIRILLWGNGDLVEQIRDVQQALEEYDGVDFDTPNRLELIAFRLQDEVDAYEWFSGANWNKKK